MVRDNETILDIAADLMSKRRRFSNSVAAAIGTRLKAAYKRETDAVRPFVRDANRYYHGGVMIAFTDEAAEQLCHNQDASQEWLNNHPEEEDNGTR